MKRLASVVDGIGATPLVHLPKLSASAGADLWGKAELFNPGGSVKDRIALAMVRAAQDDGRLRAGGYVVEATAGNTGIGLSLVCAALGYRFVAVMTSLDRGPKSELMRSLGAEVVFVEPGPRWDSDEGPLGVAAGIAAERSGVFLDQFSNPANPAVHERVTADELAAELGLSADLDPPAERRERAASIVVGVGTGGTATGLKRGLAERAPQVRVVGVAAAGSYLGPGPEDDRIAGITPDFAPKTFDQSILDGLETVTSPEAADAAGRLARTEGIPVGHTTGACLVAAEREARRYPGRTIVLVLGDSVRNYPELAEGNPQG